MDSSSLPPKPSISLPLTSREGGNSSASSSLSPVLPTPSNSTSVRSSPTSPNSINLTARPTSPLQQQSYSTKLVELQHQLAEKEKQLQESSGGIEKNVLVRQIRQLQDKMQQLEVKRQTSPTPTRMEQQQPDNSSSTSSLTSTGTYTSGAGSVDQDQLAPETMEKLRYLERDLNSYRTSLIPGVGRKEKVRQI
ncbi:hypothetical protein BC941DRAFT_265899 [Chlamydoabsidia padenii]|nr:hypothetical protein BC941DRAFT_265899 [Chlamydoabsidia padenii]